MEKFGVIKSFSVLISAYACGPNRGSEIGMGWNWVIHLSQYCRLTVITETEFREEIEQELSRSALKYAPEFIFLDIGKNARARCWDQGNWLFYRDYKKWQWNACKCANDLIYKNMRQFDIVHQLNMIGYREPGYLWKLSLPFVWGPVGGYVQMPWRYLPLLGIKGVFYHTSRNVLNSIQMRISNRVKQAVRKAEIIIAATSENKGIIHKIYGKTAVLMNETGVSSTLLNSKQENSLRQPLRLVWCGKFVSRKGLSLALRAVAAAKINVNIEFHIIGYGTHASKYKKEACLLGIDNLCIWHGNVIHSEALRIIGSSCCMLFTSLQEGTPHVVLEAIGLGIPVICHDACGHGDIINEFCGIKIPTKNIKESIRLFSEAITKIAADRVFLSNMSNGARRRAREMSWDNKAQEMVRIYQQAL